MLTVKSVTKFFGGVSALTNVSFGIESGSFVGIIGPNGSGKTTLFNIVSGVCKPARGEVFFEGNTITGLSPHKICQAGIARTFQIPHPIKTMSIVENVMIGLVFGGNKRNEPYSEKAARSEAIELINFVGLNANVDAHPDRLTPGDLRKLELARALGTKPKVLLADEIMSGLNREELKEASKILRKVRDDLGVTIIWVEHIMHVLMKLVERVIVLNYGVLICDGRPAAVCNDPQVIAAYLGQ
ncbi:MAG: ABC transporter ATP-binding protein [Desulfomonilaceae bacterium]